MWYNSNGFILATDILTDYFLPQEYSLHWKVQWRALSWAEELPCLSGQEGDPTKVLPELHEWALAESCCLHVSQGRWRAGSYTFSQNLLQDPLSYHPAPDKWHTTSEIWHSYIVKSLYSLIFSSLCPYCTIEDNEKPTPAADPELRIVVFLDDRLSKLSLATHEGLWCVFECVWCQWWFWFTVVQNHHRSCFRVSWESEHHFKVAGDWGPFNFLSLFLFGNSFSWQHVLTYPKTLKVVCYVYSGIIFI